MCSCPRLAGEFIIQGLRRSEAKGLGGGSALWPLSRWRDPLRTRPLLGDRRITHVQPACIGQSNPVSSWFARLDLSSASAAERRAVQKVSDLLDQLQPARLDPAKQTVEVSDRETWVTLRHDSEPELEIRFVLSDGWINFYGVMGHDEAYSTSSEAPDAWESETIDILADLLLADYKLEVYELWGKPWRDVVTIGEPYLKKTFSSGSFAALVLPLQRWATRVETRRASFECRGVRPAGSSGSAPEWPLLERRLPRSTVPL